MITFGPLYYCLNDTENEIKEKEGIAVLYFVCWQCDLCSPFSTFCQEFTVKPAKRMLT